MAGKPTYEELEQRVKELEKESIDMRDQKQAIKELRESESKYRTLLKNLPQKIFHKNRDLVYVSCNKNYAQDLKIKPEEIKGKTDYDFYPKALAEKYRTDDNRIISSGKTEDIEERYIQDGKELWVQTIKTPIKDKDGNAGVLGIFWDITERKRMEESLHQAHVELEKRVEERTAELALANAQLNKEIEERREMEKTLRESEERYRSLFDNNPVETIAVDKEGRVTGYNLARARGKLPNIGDVMYKDFAAKHEIDMYHELMGCIKSGEPKIFPEQKYKDTYLDIHMSPFPEGAIITAIDITDRKLAELALSTLNNISQTVNQSLDLEKILHDTLGKVIDIFKVYTSFIQLIAENTQELVVAAHKGFTPMDLRQLPLRVKLGEDTASIPIQTGKVLVVEDNSTDPRFANHHGFAKSIGCRSFVCIPLRSKDKVIGNMAIFSREPRLYTDKEIQLFTSIGHQVGIAIENARLYQDKELTIRELHEMQEILQQAYKMEAIGTLAGGIAHDFNNILSPIMIHSELAMMDLPPDNPVQYNLKEIIKAGERARDMVNQILTFSRKEEGKKAEIKITPIIRESLKLLRSTIPTTIDIHQNLEAKSDTVLADPTQIHQIMLNLGTNAAYAMRQEGGTLDVRLVQEDFTPEDTVQYSDLSPGPYLRLTVSDTGSGMDDGTLQKIFEPYFTTKEPGEGTGMGLAVIHGIVKSYGGDITVKSEQGKGATFHVVLPRIETDVSPVVERKTVLPRGTERVLFVDDEKGGVDAIQPMLESLGYKVTARTSSIEALEAFRKNPERFDLVITDMTMPNMTGKDLAKELMSIRSDIPIILCTGFSDQIDEKKAKEMGIRAFVMKPIIMGEIADTIRGVLDKE